MLVKHNHTTCGIASIIQEKLSGDAFTIDVTTSVGRIMTDLAVKRVVGGCLVAHKCGEEEPTIVINCDYIVDIEINES